MKKIVYDSPTKTKAELIFSLEQGVYVNADNLSEIERIAQVIDSLTYHQIIESKKISNPLVGLRINPQVKKYNYKQYRLDLARSKK